MPSLWALASGRAHEAMLPNVSWSDFKYRFYCSGFRKVPEASHPVLGSFWAGFLFPLFSVFLALLWLFHFYFFTFPNS